MEIDILLHYNVSLGDIFGIFSVRFTQVFFLQHKCNCIFRYLIQQLRLKDAVNLYSLEQRRNPTLIVPEAHGRLQREAHKIILVPCGRVLFGQICI